MSEHRRDQHQQQQHYRNASVKSPQEKPGCGSSSGLPCLILECRQQSTPQDPPQPVVDNSKKHVIRVFTFCPTLLCRGGAPTDVADAADAADALDAPDAANAAAASCCAKQVKLIVVCHCDQAHENTFAYPHDKQSLCQPADWTQICQALNTGCQNPEASVSSSQEAAGYSVNKEAIPAVPAPSHSAVRVSTLPYQSLFNIIPHRSVRLMDAWNQAVTEGMNSGQSQQQGERPARLSIQDRRSQFDTSPRTPPNGSQNSSVGQDGQPSTSSHNSSPRLEEAECSADMEHQHSSLPQQLTNDQLKLRRISDSDEEAILKASDQPLIDSEAGKELNSHATDTPLPPAPPPAPPQPSPPLPPLPLPPSPAMWGVLEISDSSSRGGIHSNEQPPVHPAPTGEHSELIHRRLTGPPRGWINKKRTSVDSRESDMLTEIGSADSNSRSDPPEAPLESTAKLPGGPIRSLQSVIVEADAAVAAAEAALSGKEDSGAALSPRRLPVDSMLRIGLAKRDDTVQTGFLHRKQKHKQQHKQEHSVVYQRYPLSRIYEIGPAKIDSAHEATKLGSIELQETPVASRCMTLPSLLSPPSHVGVQSDSMITQGRSIIGSLHLDSDLHERSDSMQVRAGSAESLESTMKSRSKTRSEVSSDANPPHLQGQRAQCHYQHHYPPIPHHKPRKPKSQRQNDCFTESPSIKLSCADRDIATDCGIHQKYQQRPYQHHYYEQCDHPHQEFMAEGCIQPTIPVLLVQQMVRGPACCHGQSVIALQASGELVSIVCPPRIHRCPRSYLPVDCLKSIHQPLCSRSGGSDTTCTVCRPHNHQQYNLSQQQQQNSHGSHRQQNRHPQDRQPTPLTVAARPELNGAAPSPSGRQRRQSSGDNNSQRNSARIRSSAHLDEYLSRVLSWDCSHPSAVIRSWRRTSSGSPLNARIRRSTSSIVATYHRSVPGWCSEAAVHQIQAPAEGLVAFNSDSDTSALQQRQQRQEQQLKVLGDPPNVQGNCGGF